MCFSSGMTPSKTYPYASPCPSPGCILFPSLSLLITFSPHFTMTRRLRGIEWGGIPFPQQENISGLCSGKLHPWRVDLFYEESFRHVLQHYSSPPARAFIYLENLVELLEVASIKMWIPSYDWEYQECFCQ